MQTTLLNIISAQPLANLLPIMALPDLKRVVQFHTPDFSKTAENIANAAKLAGCQAEIQNLPILDKTNEVESARQAIHEQLSRFPNSIINLTGGTKLMSLGAYLGATNSQAPTIYCDTIGSQFVPVSPALPQGIRSFSQAFSQLTIEIIMSAHGKPWKSSTENFSDFGTSAWALHSSHHAEIASWTIEVRNQISNEKGNIKKKSELLAFLPAPTTEPAKNYADLAVKHALLEKNPDGYRFHPNASSSEIKKIRNLLGGSWLEWAAAGFLSQNKQNYADVKVGLEPDKTGGSADFPETDIVAVDTKNCGLVIFSCKTSLEKVSPLEHLASLRDHANRLGGTFSRAALCLFRAKDEKQKNDLKDRAKLLKMQVHIGEEIAALSQPSR